MPPYRRAVLGGTFDGLHVGHEVLLSAAFRAGRTVGVGLTTDRYLTEHPKPDPQRIRPYVARRRALRRWLAARYPSRRWAVVALENTFGGSVAPDVDVLVVSADTVGGARAVNAERRRLGRRPVRVIVVPLVLGDDLLPVSSRRVRAGDIDRTGRRRSPIAVGVTVAAPDDFGPVGRGVRRTFPRARVRRRPGGELDLSVVRTSRGRRRVAVRSATVTLAPVGLPPQSAPALARSIERLLRRSAAAKRFSHGSG